MMKNFFKILLCQTLVFISEVFIHLKNCIDDCIYDCGCILKYQFIACHDIAEIKQSVCETSQHEIQVLNSAFFKLITTRIKTTSSKTGGEVGVTRLKVVIFLENEFEKAEFKTRIFKRQSEGPIVDKSPTRKKKLV